MSLVNTSGINIGPTANIDGTNIVISTRDITDSNFISGDYVFEKLSEDYQDMLLLNQGKITISEGGFGVLIAGAIKNEGVIVANAGKIVLAGCDAVKLDMDSSGLISIAIEAKTASTIMDYSGNPITEQIENQGTIDAPGGQVILKAESLTDVFKKSMNLSGIVKATRVVEKDGVISIVADGEVAVNTTLEASKVEVIAPVVTGVGEEPHVKADELRIEAQEIDINATEVFTTEIVAEVDLTVEEVIELEDLDIVTIIGQDFGKVTYLKTNNITLEAPRGDVNTSPGVFIPGNQVKISAKTIGSYDNPVGIDADVTYINR